MGASPDIKVGGHEAAPAPGVFWQTGAVSCNPLGTLPLCPDTGALQGPLGWCWAVRRWQHHRLRVWGL